jgi:hypothetical protein
MLRAADQITQAAAWIEQAGCSFTTETGQFVDTVNEAITRLVGLLERTEAAIEQLGEAARPLTRGEQFKRLAEPVNRASVPPGLQG